MGKRRFLLFLLLISMIFSIICASFSFFGEICAGDPVALPPSYSLQSRSSSYSFTNESIPEYPSVTMTAQQNSPINESLVEKTLNLNLTSLTLENTFTLPPDEKFLAIDGASQSLVYRVNYTAYFPNNTVALGPVSTLAGTPFHLFLTDPPSGQWRVVATSIDGAETTAWLQAISYNNGTKMVDSIEKEQVNLVPGQSRYYKINLDSPDWFYLYANRFAGETLGMYLRGPDSFQNVYTHSNNQASYLFLSESRPTGTYIFEARNNGRADLFVEILKASGVELGLEVNEGKLVESLFRFDLEFFKATITESYEWLAFDGAVLESGSGMTSRFLIIDPDFDIIYDGTSSSPHSFAETIMANNSIGTYYVGIFANEYAKTTIKITSSNYAENIANVRFDQNVTFTQSGQPIYFKIPASQDYFMVVGITYGPSRGIEYSLMRPTLSKVWNSQPSGSYAIYPPQIPTYPYYILKLQGEANASSMIHVRFGGFEDYNIQSPDCSDYWSRFPGDIIISNVSVRDSDYVLQHLGSMEGQGYVALFDVDYSQKFARSFTSSQQKYFQRWRKGYENPKEGNWLQVFIDTGVQSTACGIEISTLQSGDESLETTTPFQFTKTVSWDSWWQVETYEVEVDSPGWFGIVSQLSPVNSSYPYHPSVEMWVYDSSMKEVTSGLDIYSSSPFRTSFWSNPVSGPWLVVLAGFQHSPLSSNWDPLNCSVSFVGDADFRRDWPTDLTGTTQSFNVAVGTTQTVITVFSNSTITDFSFDAQSLEIGMHASGSDQSTGFAVISIPKEVAESPFDTFVDDYPASNVLSKENATQTLVYIPYEGGDHTLSLIPAPDVIPENISVTALSVVFSVITLVIFTQRKRPNRKQ